MMSFALQKQCVTVSLIINTANKTIVSLAQATILLVEDDPSLQKKIKQGLDEQGYLTLLAGTLMDAHRFISDSNPDCILLDINLPDGTGFELLAEWRKRNVTIPVIIMTAREKVSDKITGLDLGADDYLVKPFDFQELTARIRALLRRSTSQGGSTITLADLEIDLVSRTIKRAGRIIECTPREFDVLVYLAKSPGQAISRQMLMTEVWKVRSRMTSMDNVIDVLISRLREKIDGDRTDRLLHTVRGLGYMMKEPA
jgi:DNA-binding response OmpR family regulator